MNSGESACADITLAGIRTLLLPSRAVLLPDLGLALVADLHLGKAESLRALGAPIAHAAMDRMLDEQFTRLAAIIDMLHACRDQSRQPNVNQQQPSPRLIILGDLLHAPIGLTPKVTADVAERFAALRRSRTVETLLIRGNHDSKVDRVLTAWGLQDLGHEWIQHHAGAVIRFVHEPPIAEKPTAQAAPTKTPVGGTAVGDFAKPQLCRDETPPATITFAGHIHPAIRLRSAPGPGPGQGSAESLKLPCFWIQQSPQVCILPAFTNFASGASITPNPTDDFYVLIETKIIKL